MIPATTTGVLETSPVRGEDGIRRCRVRAGSWETPVDAVVLPSCEGDHKPYAQGDIVQLVVNEGGDANAGVYITHKHVASPGLPTPAGIATLSRLLRAPDDGWLWLLARTGGGGQVVIGDIPQDGDWTTASIPTYESLLQRLGYLQDQIDAIETAVSASVPTNGWATPPTIASVDEPDPLDRIKGAVGPAEGL